MKIRGAFGDAAVGNNYYKIDLSLRASLHEQLGLKIIY